MFANAFPWVSREIPQPCFLSLLAFRGSLEPGPGHDCTESHVGSGMRVGDSADKRRSNRRGGRLHGANSRGRGRGTRACCLRSCRACCPKRQGTPGASSPLRASDSDRKGQCGRTQPASLQTRIPPHSLTISVLPTRLVARNPLCADSECLVGGMRKSYFSSHNVPRPTTVAYSEIIRQILNS